MVTCLDVIQDGTALIQTLSSWIPMTALNHFTIQADNVKYMPEKAYFWCTYYKKSGFPDMTERSNGPRFPYP